MLLRIPRPTSRTFSFTVRFGEKARLREFTLRGSFLCRYDEHSHERFPPGDPSKRAFTYFVLTGGRFIYASALRLAVLKFILSMSVGAAVSPSYIHSVHVLQFGIQYWTVASKVD